MQAKQKGDPQTPRKPRLTGPTWKMPKSVKASLSMIVDPVARAHFKQMMIDAWATQQRHAAENAKKKDRKNSGKQDDLL